MGKGKGGKDKGKGKVKGDKGKKGKGKGKGDKGKGKKGGKGGKGKAKAKVVIEPHRFAGVFVSKGKDDSLVTRNLVPGESVYGEKRLSAEAEEGEEKVEYRVWNPFRSKLGAGIVGGIEQMPVKPGAKVLYLGGASGTTVSHVSDMIGPEGVVYAVEFSHRCGRDLTNMAKRRPNVVPIVEDARQPQRYRMLIGMVDVIFADVAQPDQARIVTHNASFFLKKFFAEICCFVCWDSSFRTLFSCAGDRMYSV